MAADPTGVEPARRAEMQRLFWDLRKAGVDHRDLHLAWSFTVASDDGIAGRARAVRDGAFAALGDTDLADGVVDGAAPSLTVTNVANNPNPTTARRIEGTVLVASYLHGGTQTPGADGGVPLLPLLSGTAARFGHATAQPGPGDLPIRSPAAPWLSVPYVCNIPTTATAADPASLMLYGHGLLFSRTQASGSSTELLRPQLRALRCRLRRHVLSRPT